jgi:hypothetical protein
VVTAGLKTVVIAGLNAEAIAGLNTMVIADNLTEIFFNYGLQAVVFANNLIKDFSPFILHHHIISISRFIKIE